MIPNDEALAGLRHRHGAWEIWRVDRFAGGPVWCARPAGKAGPVLHAGEPAHLSEQIDGHDEADRPREHPAGTRLLPRERAVRRMRAVADALAEYGMITHLHDSFDGLDLSARLCPPGDRGPELIFDEDGYTEIRYWVSADADAGEVTARALHVLAAATSPAGEAPAQEAPVPYDPVPRIVR